MTMSIKPWARIPIIAAVLGLPLMAGCGEPGTKTTADSAGGRSQGAGVVGTDGASAAEGGTSTGAASTTNKK